MKPIETVKYRDQRFLIQACRTGTLGKSAVAATLVDHSQMVDGSLMAVYDFFALQKPQEITFLNKLV